MSKNYDNWEKLVGAVLNIEQLRQLAVCNSTNCSTISDDISCLDDDAPKAQTLSLYYDATHTATIWGMFLSPPQDLETISRLAPGKEVFLPVEAREFVIQTEDSPAQYLPFSSEYEFETVEISSFSAVDIRGKIRTRLLTSKTIYGVYLIFKLAYAPPMMMRGTEGERRQYAVVMDGQNSKSEVFMWMAETSRRSSRQVIDGRVVL
ncbi:non-specific serine/threonine protein kinase [Salvia divinorum]|uniref:Non-specific serine/threonine protein kinase n=1 Tax=Salvia divinorum TaxID=28513 RepID=A0ABD1GW44_SALDI